MYRIGVIEDEPAYRRELQNAIAECTDGSEHRIQCFDCGEQFLQSGWATEKYGVLFIDIELPGMNGMELARKLRQGGYCDLIVFTTNFEEYVYEGYEVEAFRYLRKPVRIQDIAVCMERADRIMQEKMLVFMFKRKRYSIPYRDISYISSYGHYLTVHTREQDYDWKYLLKELQPQLPEQFVRCHRSFIVNLDYMRRLDGKRMFLKTGEEIDVAGGYLEDVRRAISRMI